MYKIFSIAIPSDGAEEADMNRFLAMHRIVSIRTQWVMRGDVPYEVFTVEYQGEAPAKKDQPSQRIDYRDELEPEQFIRYCKMRDERKKIADNEAIKAFMVFTNEQLAAIARIENPTLADLKKINGVGEAKVEKYGARIIESIREQSKDVESGEGATST